MTNSIPIAPQISDVSSLFEVWKRSNIGSKGDFVSFISRPSGERMRFLAATQVEVSLHGSLLFNQVTAE